MSNWAGHTAIRGHDIFTWDWKNWYYDDGELYTDNDRPCTRCGVYVAHDQPDPCLGWLEGVDFACCGHGNEYYEYVAANGARYDTVESWLLDTQRGTINPRQNQREV